MAIVETTLLLAKTTVVTETLKKALGLIADSTSSELRKLVRKWKNESVAKKLYSQLSKVRRVKTLWSLDKPIDLSHFYCNTHVHIGKRRKKIVFVEDFGTKEHLLIEGIAGQGKSIFLRYLAAITMARGTSIPLFVELRRIGEDQSVTEYCLQALKVYGLDVDELLWDEMLKKGDLLLLFDAFDEIQESQRQKILFDLEDIAATYPETRIIVTTRPDSELRVSPHFSNCRISNLEGGEYETVIRKLLDNTAICGQLLGAIPKPLSLEEWNM